MLQRLLSRKGFASHLLLWLAVLGAAALSTRAPLDTGWVPVLPVVLRGDDRGNAHAILEANNIPHTSEGTGRTLVHPSEVQKAQRLLAQNRVPRYMFAESGYGERMDAVEVARRKEAVIVALRVFDHVLDAQVEVDIGKACFKGPWITTVTVRLHLTDGYAPSEATLRTMDGVVRARIPETGPNATTFLDATGRELTGTRTDKDREDSSPEQPKMLTTRRRG